MEARRSQVGQNLRGTRSFFSSIRWLAGEEKLAARRLDRHPSLIGTPDQHRCNGDGRGRRCRNSGCTAKDDLPLRLPVRRRLFSAGLPSLLAKAGLHGDAHLEGFVSVVLRKVLDGDFSAPIVNSATRISMKS